MHDHPAPAPAQVGRPAAGSTPVGDAGSGRILLVQPDAGRAPVARLLDGATSSLTLKMYSLTDPVLSDALAAAAQRGVTVRAILNAVRTDGSRDNDEAFARLDAAGIAVRWSSKRFSASHEKSLVVDGAVALLGSFNWGEKYFGETRDFGVITHVPVEVDAIARCFEADWNEVPFEDGVPGTLLWAPGTARRQVAAMIAGAHHTISLQHALLADATVLLRLTEAAARGVHVRFLCAGGRGLKLWDRPETFASLRILHNAGGKVRRLRTPKMHGNLTIVDDRVAQLGSLHYQHGAFDTRRDLSIELHDARIVAELVRVFHADWDTAEHYLPHDPIEHGETDPLDRDVWRA